MVSKTLIWIGVFIGSSLGGFIPSLFGADLLSYWGLIGSSVGGLLGIWAGAKLSNYV